ncbi:MAG TPA: hypothetical protein PKK01_07270, partial [Mycobacterium sp.]|nr:hypothetical protein [Mycobacterium sp.]
MGNDDAAAGDSGGHDEEPAIVTARHREGGQSMWVLLGIAVIVAGFMLRFNPLFVILAAAVLLLAAGAGGFFLMNRQLSQTGATGVALVGGLFSLVNQDG